MKKIRYGCLALLCVLMMIGISACGRSNNGTKGTTSAPSQSAATATESSRGMENSTEKSSAAMDETGTGADRAKESTGVIDGLLNDVGNGIEEGVQDVERAVEGTHASSAAETSAGR